MNNLKEKNPKFQCFSCGEVIASDEWNKSTNDVYENNIAKLPEHYIENNHDMTTVGVEESDATFSCFVCPNCESAPMANELIYVPDGKKVSVDTVSVARFNAEYEQEICLEYNIFLVEELKPLHKYKEYPIRDCRDYDESNPTFKSLGELGKTLCKENILNFIKDKHPDLMEFIEDKGLFLIEPSPT